MHICIYEKNAVLLVELATKQYQRTFGVAISIYGHKNVA